MRLQITNKKLSEIKADLELIFVVDKDLKHKFIKDEKAFKFANYKGESILLLTEQARLYVPLNKLNFEEFRLSAAKAYNALKTLNVKTVKLNSYLSACGCAKTSFQAFAEGFLLGAYEFNKYKEKKKFTRLKILFLARRNLTTSNLT